MKMIIFSPTSGGLRAGPKHPAKERKHKKTQSIKSSAFITTCKGIYLMQGELTVHLILCTGDQRFTAI